MPITIDSLLEGAAGAVSTFTDSVLGFTRSSRTIATFTPTLVIEESIEDSSDITQHPIEDGSVITDHVIFKPTTVTMEVYFSEDSFSGLSPKETYQQFLNLRASSEPFTITLGKRTLENMLFKSIKHTTNADSEYVLALSLEFQQIKVVTLQEVTIATPQNQQASTQSSGKKQAQTSTNAANNDSITQTAEKNNSGLYDIFYG